MYTLVRTRLFHMTILLQRSYTTRIHLPFSHVRLLIPRPLRLLAFSLLSPLIPGYLKYADFTPDRRVVLCNCSIVLIVSWIVNVFR